MPMWVIWFRLICSSRSGHDPSRAFHKNVNKRNIPTYYEVIKEPIAMSNIKASLANRTYTAFPEFVRDCALLWHNAHTYNRPDAGAYQDASVLKDLMEQEFKRLAEQKTVPAGVVEWPDLGEIPPVEDVPEGGRGRRPLRGVGRRGWQEKTPRSAEYGKQEGRGSGWKEASRPTTQSRHSNGSAHEKCLKSSPEASRW